MLVVGWLPGDVDNMSILRSYASGGRVSWFLSRHRVRGSQLSRTCPLGGRRGHLLGTSCSQEVLLLGMYLWQRVGSRLPSYSEQHLRSGQVLVVQTPLDLTRRKYLANHGLDVVVARRGRRSSRSQYRRSCNRVSTISWKTETADLPSCGHLDEVPVEEDLSELLSHLVQRM